MRTWSIALSIMLLAFGLASLRSGVLAIPGVFLIGLSIIPLTLTGPEIEELKAWLRSRKKPRRTEKSTDRGVYDRFLD